MESRRQLFVNKRGEEILEPEHFMWKVAHYTWCNYLRKNKYYSRFVLTDELSFFDERDFVAEMAEKQEQEEVLKQIRRSISRLSYLKREIMISFYIDRKQIKDIAEKYNLTESAVKWYLHSERKRIKEEIGMEQKNYVYRPQKLHMAISGQVVAAPDTMVINQSLSMQNICLECYHHATAFVIEDLKQTQDIYQIYCNHKEKLLNAVISGLCEKEEIIRKIGFYGSDMPMEKLLWLLIYRFCSSIKKPVWTIQAPIRPDGGKYFPLGFDRNVKGSADMENYITDWGYNGPMNIDGFKWFGFYNFSDSEIVHLLDGYDGQAKYHKLLRKLLDNMG